MLKKIAILVAVLLLIVGAGAYYVSTNLSSIVSAAVEKYGTAATQASVKLSGFKIVPLSGEASIAGFSVGSPKGFSADKSLYLGGISIKIDPNSIRGTGPIVIEDVTIDKPQVTYEVDNEGNSNLQTLAKNAQAYAATYSHSATSPKAKEDAPTESKPGRKIIIKTLLIRDGQIGVSQAMLKGQTFSATLPAIHMNNIGKSEGGATPAEIAQQLIGVLTTTASRVASEGLANQAVGAVREKAGSLIGGQLNGLLGK